MTACGFKHAKVTCNECPWRRDVPVGRFPPERFEALARSVDQGFAPVFACHKSPDAGEFACAGYLMRDGTSNFRVRLALIDKQIDLTALVASGPLYGAFREMAKANGARLPRKKRQG